VYNYFISHGFSKMMSKRAIRKVHPLLKIISRLGNDERQVLIHFLTHEACEGIYECIQNGLTNPTLKEEDKRELHNSLLPQKNKFRRLLKESHPEKKKRTLLQVGEGAGLILEKVVPLLEEFLERAK
jgi:hypothetical protein